VNFRSQLWIIIYGLSLVAIWLTLGSFFSGSPGKNASKKEAVSDSFEPPKHQRYDKTKAYTSGRKNPSARRDLSRSRPASPHLDPSAQIGDLIARQDLSHDEIAAQLAAIAFDKNAPEAERLEAMEHGANLGFSHLVPLSLDPNLPLPIAESYLHGLHGHDQVKEQVSGALGLLNHVDQEIREQAQILLGFLLQAEEDNESPEKLLKKADEFLMRQDQPYEGDDEVSGQ